MQPLYKQTFHPFSSMPHSPWFSPYLDKMVKNFIALKHPSSSNTKTTPKSSMTRSTTSTSNPSATILELKILIMTITVKFNNLIHEFLYMKLRERIVKPTSCLDFEALRHFNVHNEILEILFDFKLDTFTHISLLSHESLTFEFLISFSYDLNH